MRECRAAREIGPLSTDDQRVRTIKHRVSMVQVRLDIALRYASDPEVRDRLSSSKRDLDAALAEIAK